MVLGNLFYDFKYFRMFTNIHKKIGEDGEENNAVIIVINVIKMWKSINEFLVVDVLIDNTTKSKLERCRKKPRKKPTIFKTKASILDEKTKILIEQNKLKAKSLINEVVAKNKEEIDKETNVFAIEINLEPKIEEMEEPMNADQVRTRYKAIVNNKFKKENREPEKLDVNEMNKHKDNIKTILQNSNATVIKGFWGNGYSCNFCEEQREIPSELKQHNLEAHSNVGEDAVKVKYVSDLVLRLDITDLKCKVCNTSINSLEDLSIHLTKTHSKIIHTDIKNHIIPFKFNTEKLQCAMCEKEFKFFKLLSEHMSEHYRNYVCSVCERAFINKQSMQTHSYRHNKGVFKCSHCPKVFDSRPKRSVHERVVHALSNKTRKCSFCSERFATKDLVQNHEVKAHGVKPTVYSCQACNKSYHSQSSLITHRKRFHLMLRPHKCTYCDMAFFSKIELRSHIVTHTKSRDFKCEMCPTSFVNKCSLNQHVRGQLDDRRFKCEDCNRTFVHRTAWRVHMRTKHSRIV